MFNNIDDEIFAPKKTVIKEKYQALISSFEGGRLDRDREAEMFKQFEDHVKREFKIKY